MKREVEMRVLRALIGALCAIALSGPAFAAGAILPPGRQTFVDANGVPLVGGFVYTYIPSTTTPKSTWQDQAETTLNANPITLDSRGQASIYGTGAYREIVQDSSSNQIWDKNIQAPALDDLSNVTAIAAPRGAIGGLMLSTAGSSATFTVAAGSATDSTGTTGLILSLAMNKTTASWVAGAGNGALDAGSIANNTWYFVYLIKRLDTGAVDVEISAQANTPALPTNYTQYRRIGAMKTNGSAQWINFMQFGDEFYWVTSVLDVNAGTAGGVANLTTPPGIVTEAILHASGFYSSGGTATVKIYPTFVSGGQNLPLIASPVAGNPINGETRVVTNTASQVNVSFNSGAGGTYSIETMGWIDRRGRDD